MSSFGFDELATHIQVAGDLSLLREARRALLVSRTRRNPSPGTGWVRATVEAVEESVSLAECIVTGTGRDPYDLVLAACLEADGSAVVVLDTAPPTQHCPAALLPRRHLLVWPAHGTSRLTPSERDLLIGRLSDRAWAISVRPGGNMEMVEASLRARHCSVDPWPIAGEPPHERDSHPHPAATPLLETWDYLTHYTREPDGAWSGESRTDFIRWLMRGNPGEVRTAETSLHRILTMRRITGSSRLMPERNPMVSFTARAPWETAGLIRWRSGLHRWTFRPYGIAIRSDELARLGARPVRYLPRREIARLPPAQVPFAQKHDPPRTDWSDESEWRLPGDLDLAGIPASSTTVLVPTRAQVQRFAREYGIEAIAICEP